jgi:iron(III) transport system permease protein
MLNESPDTWPAIRTSVLLGLEGATISTLLAFIIAYVCIRSRSRSTAGLDLLANVPAGIPATVTGVGFLIAFIRPPVVLYGTRWLLLLAYLVIFLPIAIRPISASIRQVSRELEDASRIAGASWISTIRHVTLPLVLTSLLAGWALLFIMLTREVSASVFLVAAGVRLVGTTIFGLWTNGQNPQLAAFSILVTLGSLIFVAFAQWMSSRQTLRIGWGRRASKSAVSAPSAPTAVPGPLIEPLTAPRVESVDRAG